MRMKKFFVIISILMFGAAFLSCGKDSKTVAKLKGDKITLGELNSFYYAQQKVNYNLNSDEEVDKLAANPDEVQRNPTLDKREFLENLIRQRLVVNKAIDDGIMKKKDVKAILEIQKEAFLMLYYIKDKYKDQLQINDQDISKIYAAQRDRFKGVPIDQAEQYIRQQLVTQKLQGKLREVVETLKEEGGIQRNLDLLPSKAANTDTANKDDAAKAPVKEEPKK